MHGPVLIPTPVLISMLLSALRTSFNSSSAILISIAALIIATPKLATNPVTTGNGMAKNDDRRFLPMRYMAAPVRAERSSSMPWRSRTSRAKWLYSTRSMTPQPLDFVTASTPRNEHVRKIWDLNGRAFARVVIDGVEQSISSTRGLNFFEISRETCAIVATGDLKCWGERAGRWEGVRGQWSEGLAETATAEGLGANRALFARRRCVFAI